MLAFIHVQKAAGTTMQLILRSSFGLRHLDVETWHARFTREPFTAGDLRRVRRFFPHLKSIQGHRVVPYADLDEACRDIRYYTFMREPLAQCASWFQFLVQKKGKSELVFEDYIQTDFPRNRHTQLLTGTDDVEAAIRIIHEKNIFVGLVEHFDESLLLLKALVANDLNLAYERRNVASGNEIARNLLTSFRQRQMLLEATEADRQLYDYVRNELYPSYQRAYGNSLQEDVECFRASPDAVNRVNVRLAYLQRIVLYKPLLYLYRICA